MEPFSIEMKRRRASTSTREEKRARQNSGQLSTPLPRVYWRDERDRVQLELIEERLLPHLARIVAAFAPRQKTLTWTRGGKERGEEKGGTICLWEASPERPSLLASCRSLNFRWTCFVEDEGCVLGLLPIDTGEVLYALYLQDERLEEKTRFLVQDGVMFYNETSKTLFYAGGRGGRLGHLRSQLVFAWRFGMDHPSPYDALLQVFNSFTCKASIVFAFQQYLCFFCNWGFDVFEFTPRHSSGDLRRDLRLVAFASFVEQEDIAKAEHYLHRLGVLGQPEILALTHSQGESGYRISTFTLDPTKMEGNCSLEIFCKLAPGRRTMRNEVVLQPWFYDVHVRPCLIPVEVPVYQDAKNSDVKRWADDGVYFDYVPPRVAR